MSELPPKNQPPGKSMGKGMLTVGWILILILLSMLFGNWSEKRYNPNQNLENLTNEGPTQVKLKRNRFNHYVATGKINGKDAVFLLDTGATHVAVPIELADKLNLKPGAKSIVNTANGSVEVRLTTINLLELGPIRLLNVRASIVPNMPGGEILLGMSALKDLEFIQRGDELTITQL